MKPNAIISCYFYDNLEYACLHQEPIQIFFQVPPNKQIEIKTKALDLIYKKELGEWLLIKANALKPELKNELVQNKMMMRFEQIKTQIKLDNLDVTEQYWWVCLAQIEKIKLIKHDKSIAPYTKSELK